MLEQTKNGFTAPAVGPDLVVLITDGNPTTHNGSGGDLGNAITAANVSKAVGPNHPHITGVAVGGDIDLGNIGKITGAGAGLGGLDPDVHSSDTNTLVNDVKALAARPARRRHGHDPQAGPHRAEQHRQHHAWSGRRLDVRCLGRRRHRLLRRARGAAGTGVVNLDFSADLLGANTITESAGLAGYSIESATCNGQDAKLSVHHPPR